MVSRRVGANIFVGSGNGTLSGQGAPKRAVVRARHLTATPIAVIAVCCLAATASISLLPVMAGGWLATGSAVGVLIIVAPMAGMLLLPIAVAFGSLVALDVHGIHIGPTDLIVAALAVSWGVRELPRILGNAIHSDASDTTLGARQHRLLAMLGRMLRLPADLWQRDWLRTLLYSALLAYLGVIILSFAVAVSKTSVIKETVKWAEVATLVMLTSWAVCTPRRLRLAVWAFIAAGLAEALLGYWQWVLASGAAGPGGDTLRVLGTFGQPNPYSGYLNFALLPAVAITLFGRDIRERWLAGAVSVLLLGAQTLANSRGGLIGLICGVAVVVVVGLRRERLAALVAAIGAPLLAIAWLAHLIPTRITTNLLSQFRLNDVSVNGQVSDANFSTMERLAHWIAGIRMFQAHPILGVGAGNYDAAYSRYGDLARWPESLAHAHNYYINVAAETGSLGLIAFLALVVAIVLLGWRATHPTTGRAPSRAVWPFALGLFAVLIALIAHNLTDNLFVHGIELQLAMCIGCLLRMKD